MKKKKTSNGSVQNKRARFDYDLKDSFMAGLVLTGPEVRSIRMSHASLQGSFINIKDNEAWLMNSQVMPVKTNAAHLPSELQSRNRKLLLKKRELASLVTAKNQGLTIIPTKILTKGRYIKLEIAIAKGKKLYDKRETIKRRDVERDNKRAAKI